MKSYYCKDINNLFINKKIILNGWIYNKKILKNIIFINLRDSSGEIQLVCYKNNINFDKISKLKCESCIKVCGFVKHKKLLFINKNIYNNFEIEIKYINLLCDSNSLPIDFNSNLSEYQKLKFRYLYLRNKKPSNLIKIKSEINWYVHKFMRKNNFLNIETPILSKRFIHEGSKNYIVSSRKYNNKYYSLSQSPQLFKQILMISGFDKYYQIAKCFRDEDLRSDRQPEFTQIDFEVSFKYENYIYNITEKLIKYIFKQILNINIDNKFKKITFKESINKFGTDKPDLRSLLEIIHINNLLNVDNLSYMFDIIHIPNGIYIKNINNYIINFNLNNNLFILNFNKFKYFLNYLNLNINNILYEKIIFYLNKNTININNDLILIYIIDKNLYSIEIISKIRTYIGIQLSVEKFSFIWITDFPMFKLNNGNIESMHHPFSSPKKNNINKINKLYINKNINSLLSRSYDLVINGYEVASGSVRINNRKTQELIFDLLNISKIDQKKYFGFFLDALSYGAPPHSGIAIGLDRLTMLITNINNIKDIIAFPKTSSAYDLLMDFPN
ncbi:aspartate--tRNA ligase [endosymbiont of Pachyrhynchus infernalis]|uniref:aspartate--tRNA ligase n=1 Tax=endosymbiont of Pachyrhynchus infernalis TaxID=1971488 RepID=UPI000DC72646|nr:aspartate--tRNA ligase [endosymbiont of Pachyrhynchus infernalis]BBA84787.1 aspartyl-tRNA synthetase [endosymbiont of Pachyrhynchus infernalis]